MINTVLMDLDGTLLPFEQDAFIKAYMKLLCADLAPKGYAPEQIVQAVWAGCDAMINNDGTVLNSVRFWDAFAAVLGDRVRTEEDNLDGFYLGAFDKARLVLDGESCAKELVDTLKEKGYTVVLATNPLFPEQAQRTRMAWAGLTLSDFALVTHYSNSHFCKPDLRYYEEILQTIGKTPTECLMIGNNVAEDMIAEQLGMDVCLITGHVENPQDKPIDRFVQKSLGTFLEYAKTLPSIK